MLKYQIRTIPHGLQRYDTVGDYVVDRGDGATLIAVSDLGCWKMELLVAVHELIESALCLDHEVSHAVIDHFDMKWRPHGDIDEPGNDLMAPYWEEHQVASGFERLLAAQLGVNWVEYERRIAALSPPRGTDHERERDRAGDPGEGT